MEAVLLVLEDPSSPRKTGLSLWEAGQTRDEIVNGYPPVATDQQGQQS